MWWWMLTRVAVVINLQYDLRLNNIVIRALNPHAVENMHINFDTPKFDC